MKKLFSRFLVLALAAAITTGAFAVPTLADEMQNGEAVLQEEASPATVDETEDLISTMSTECCYNGWKYTINYDGTATITGYTYSTSSLTIPSYINGHKVTEIGDWAFENMGISTLTIPETIQSIGRDAFSKCYYLSQIYFNARACSNFDARYNPFYDAGRNKNSLSVVFGSTVRTIPANMFCTQADYDSGYGHFSHVTSVSMSSSVTEIGDYAFEGCYELTALKLSSGLKKIGDFAFHECNLSTITIPEKVTYLGKAAFKENYNLKKIVFNARSCEDVDTNYCNPFYGAGKNRSSLTVVFGSSVKRIPANLFNTGVWCYTGNESYAHITSVSIPSSVTYIGVCAFDYCHDLVKFVIKSKSAKFADTKFYDTNSRLTFYCYKGSTAAKFAAKNGYRRHYPTTYYSITYKLNGGKNSSKNPTKYTGKTTVTLSKPVKKGYTFVGWYTSSSYKTKVTKISKGKSGNITLYARWRKN